MANISSFDKENKTAAFLIECFLELDNWKILEISDEISYGCLPPTRSND